MTCKCGQTFCFLCDVKLTRAVLFFLIQDHNSHFKDDNVRAKECRVWQDGKWVDRDKARVVPVVVGVAAVGQHVVALRETGAAGAAIADLWHGGSDLRG